MIDPGLKHVEMKFSIELFCVHNIDVCTRKCTLASSPGILRGKGEGRPGIHCMRICCYYSDFE